MNATICATVYCEQHIHFCILNVVVDLHFSFATFTNVLLACLRRDWHLSYPATKFIIYIVLELS